DRFSPGESTAAGCTLLLIVTSELGVASLSLRDWMSTPWISSLKSLFSDAFSFRLDTAQMTRHRYPGPAKPQQGAADQQRQEHRPPRPREAVATLVKGGEGLDFIAQGPEPQPYQEPGKRPAGEAVPEPRVEKGPPHIAVGTTDQLDHHDLIAAALDRQADGVTHHQQHPHPQHHPQPQGKLATDLNQGVKLLQPGQIHRHLVDDLPPLEPVNQG